MTINTSKRSIIALGILVGQPALADIEIDSSVPWQSIEGIQTVATYTAPATKDHAAPPSPIILTASRKGVTIEVFAQQDGKTIGKAQAPIGLRTLDIYIRTEGDMEKLSLRWPEKK